MKPQLEQLLLAALDRLPAGVLPELPMPGTVVLERTRDPQHGDFATNVAMRLSKAAGLNPRELAQAIVAALPSNPLIERAEMAGAGFINFFVAAEAYARELASVHDLGDRYGSRDLGRGERVIVEFVSANPAGRLSVRQGRQAAYAAALSNILCATGFDVAREYYIDDAGRQTGIVGLTDIRDDLQLRAEVGNDVCRLFYLMRSHDQPLDFDLELAKTRNTDNPAYYIQYAHARVASIMKQLRARELSFDRGAGLTHLSLLTDPHEQTALRTLARYPEALELAAVNRAPHTLVHYLRELATTLHTYYNAELFTVSDTNLRNARLALVLGVQQVLRNGLTLLGVSAPETM